MKKKWKKHILKKEDDSEEEDLDEEIDLTKSKRNGIW